MNYLTATVDYLTDPAHWTGSLGIGSLMIQHIGYSVAGVALASVIGVPLGWWVGHTGRARSLAVAASGAARAVPTLGLITLLGLALGIGLRAPMIAFVVLALPSVLAGAYSGIESADRQAVDGALACGMSPWQVLMRVEVPLGVVQLLGGLRSASLQVIATATLAAYTAAGGLGRLMFLGIKTHNYVMMMASSVMVIILALASECFFGLLQNLLRPAGVGTRKDKA